MRKVTMITLFLLLCVFINTGLAVNVTLLGPKKYLRSKSQPIFQTDIFPGIIGEGKLIVKNGDDNGKYRISSAEIKINGKQVLGYKDFNQQVDYIEIPLTLKEGNEISVKLNSKVGSYLTVNVVQEIDAEAAGVIGAEGGTIEVTDPDSEIYGAKIEFLPDTVDEDILFLLKYDELNDNDELIALPIIVYHKELALKKDVNVTLPLKQTTADDTTLMLMVLDELIEEYIPAGLLVEVENGSLFANFNLSHFSGISLADAYSVIKKWDNPSTMLIMNSLFEVTEKIDLFMENSDKIAFKIFLSTWEALSICDQINFCQIPKEIAFGSFGINFIDMCDTNDDCSYFVIPLKINVENLILFIQKTLSESICEFIGLPRTAVFPGPLFPEVLIDIKRPSVIVGGDDCVGRCGKGCPGDGYPSCGDQLRYTQTCLDHDACVQFYNDLVPWVPNYGYIAPQCLLVLEMAGNDCMFAPACKLSDILNEDFESYPLNTWPSSWVPDANAHNLANNRIVQDPENPSNKVLKIHGSLGGCWSAITYHPFVPPDEFFVELKVYNGSEILTGCHPARGGFGMKRGTHWSIRGGYTFMMFNNNNTVGHGWSDVLSNYQTNQWYNVKIHYQRSGDQVTLSYWIDGEYLGQTTDTVDLNTYLAIDHFKVFVEEGTAYFDDIKVYTP